MKIDPRVMFTLVKSPKDYASGIVEIFKAGLKDGLNQYEIRCNIRDMLLSVQAIKNKKQLDLEVRNCLTPCEFAITTYMLLNRLTPQNPNMLESYKQILKTMEDMAPDFVGEKERQALPQKIS